VKRGREGVIGRRDKGARGEGRERDGSEFRRDPQRSAEIREKGKKKAARTRIKVAAKIFHALLVYILGGIILDD
jgi:hypothetical protein